MLPRSALPDPKLVDVVDDEWMEDELPDDGACRREGVDGRVREGTDLGEGLVDVVLPEGVAPPTDEQEDESE